jgi:ribonuclease HI
VKVKIYSDGGARGNPGPAACAFVIIDEVGKLVKEDAAYLGERTNNQAEYEALISGLRAAVGIRAEAVTCYLDSELVGKHLTGKYQVKNAELLKLYQRVQVLKKCFQTVIFVNVPRTNSFIQEADRLVNQKLDQTGH